MEERRENNNLLIATLEKIDKRTENIDKRLREVEQKINNGFTTKIAETNDNVKLLGEAYREIKQEAIKDRASREAMLRHRAAVYKAIGAFAAISGIVFGVVRIFG